MTTWPENERQPPLNGTPRQWGALAALGEHGSYSVAARMMGISERTCRRHVRRLRDRNNMTTAQLLWAGPHSSEAA